jgi:hypothetical protein
VVGIGLVAVSARPTVVEFTSHDRAISLLLPKDRRAVMTFENVSTFLRQDDERAVVARGWRDLYETRFFEMPEVAHAGVERTFLSVPQVAGANDAEASNDRERA